MPMLFLKFSLLHILQLYKPFSLPFSKALYPSPPGWVNGGELAADEHSSFLGTAVTLLSQEFSWARLLVSVPESENCLPGRENEPVSERVPDTMVVDIGGGANIHA